MPPPAVVPAPQPALALQTAGAGARADQSVRTLLAQASRDLGRVNYQTLDADGRRLAGFRQTTRAWAGSRVLDIEIEFDQLEEPRADPWNSYYAARFAWPDQTAEQPWWFSYCQVLSVGGAASACTRAPGHTPLFA